MLLKIKYEDIQASGARGEVGGKKVNFFMRVEVNELNFQEALAKFDSNKWVAVFDYVGELGFLAGVQFGTKPVIITKQFEKLDMNLDFFMNEVDSRLRVAIELPKDYTDMRAVMQYSKKYPNMRFCGGKLLRIDGANLGAVTQAEIHKKIPDSRIPIIAEGCGCILPNLTVEEADVVEFYDAKTLVKEKKVKEKTATLKQSKAKAKSKPKKQLSSLLSLANTGTGDLDNF